jgi:hypothetical protein
LKRLGDATMMLEKSQSDGSRPIEALKKSAFKKRVLSEFRRARLVCPLCTEIERTAVDVGKSAYSDE